jgi:3-oxoacyl-[acyl-carrier protein] reductase
VASSGDRQVAFVTGASRGLGAACAELLAGQGWRVVAAARSFVGPPCAPPETGVCPYALDVTDAGAVDKALSFTLDRYGRLDLLVSCAGESDFAPVLECSVSRWRTVLETHLTGFFLCARAAAARMAEHGGGRIVAVSSVAARRALPECGPYGAAKAGIEVLARVLAEELRDSGVRVSLLVPGAIDTPLWDGRRGFDRGDMLQAREVARVVVNLAARPLTVGLEEVVVLPPKGVL